MSLGGYKFVGYHYPARTPASGSDAEKAVFLDWFKCRLTAFFESCAASGAEWHLLEECAEDGDWVLTIPGIVAGECIHELDDSGVNFGVFLQYGTENKYMAIVMTAKTTTEQDAGRRSFKTSGSPYVYFDRSLLSIAIDINPITPDNLFSKPTGRIPLSSPTVAWGNTSPGSQTVSAYTTGIYFGFATKDSDVIEFTYSYSSMESVNKSYFRWLAISPDAFSSLCSPTDVYRGAAISSNFVITAESNIYENDPLCYPAAILKNNGAFYEGYSSYGAKSTGFSGDRIGVFRATNSVMPFVSPTVGSMYNLNSIPSSDWINDDGILAKGIIKADLLAINSDLSGNLRNIYQPGTAYGGGNYLGVVGRCESSGLSPYQTAVYIGWDPSNPNIFASTSWPEWPNAISGT